MHTLMPHMPGVCCSFVRSFVCLFVFFSLPFVWLTLSSAQYYRGKNNKIVMLLFSPSKEVPKNKCLQVTKWMLEPQNRYHNKNRTCSVRPGIVAGIWGYIYGRDTTVMHGMSAPPPPLIVWPCRRPGKTTSNQTQHIINHQQKKKHNKQSHVIPYIIYIYIHMYDRWRRGHMIRYV